MYQIRCFCFVPLYSFCIFYLVEWQDHVLNDVGVSFPAGPRVSSSKKKQDSLHGPLSPPFHEYLGLFPQRTSGWGMKLNFHLSQCHYVSTPVTFLQCMLSSDNGSHKLSVVVERVALKQVFLPALWFPPVNYHSMNTHLLHTHSSIICG
jgi:hypothetical protein